MKLRVVTYNIHKGVTGISRRPRIQNVRAGLHAMDADIVFLQEVQDRNDRLVAAALFDPEHTQLNYLATDAYPHSVYGRNAVYDYGHHGNAILSRHPILMSENLDISDHRFEQRGLLHAVIEVEGVPVHAIVVHLGLIKGSRVRQVALLRDFIDKEIPPGDRLVVAGDFNDWGARMRYAMNAMGLRDSSDLRGPRTLTYPSRLPLTQLDFIYARHMPVTECAVPRGPVWARMSDHLPLVSDFSL